MSFCEAYSYRGDYDKIFVIIFICSFIMCVLCIGNSICFNIGLLIVNSGSIFVIIKNYKLIEKELVILYEYIKRQYYIYMNLKDIPVDTSKSHIMLLKKPVYERFTLIIILVLLIMILAMTSLRIKWDFLVIMPVIAIIGMEMFHGKAPSLTSSCFLVTGVSGLLFGIKFEMYGGRRNFFQHRHIVGQIWTRYIIFAVIITVSIIVAVQTGNYTKDMVFVNSEKALQREHEIERKIKVMAQTIKSKVLKESSGYLDNKSPDQTGRFIMRIETDRLPADNIYIRSFYADKYDGKRWNNSDKKAPLSEDDINHIFSRGLKRFLKSGLTKSGLTDMDTIKIELFPEENNSGNYIPYMSISSEKNNSGSYTFYCYNAPSHIKNDILTTTDDELLEIPGIKDYKKYTSYVNNKYLSLPYNAGNLDDFASKIDLYNKTGLQCIAVKNAICKDTKYSQKLKELPPGKDYIEYFLFEQKKGYCEHYATAGTVLLRFKGVPARYAAGYNISPFEFNAKYDNLGNLKYVAYVRDYNAHAWTEVYKRGFGWMPFDMTNSITDSDYTSNAILNPIGTENQTPSEKDEQDKEKETEKNDESDKKDNVTQDDTSKTKDTQKKNKKSESENSTNKSKKREQNSKYNPELIVFLGIFFLFLLFVIIFVAYNRIRFMLLFKKLSMADTSSERVVIYFGILNQFLAFCGIKHIDKLEDAEYTKKLYSTFKGKIPQLQINRACEILQCAAFSNSDIGYGNEEEAVSFIRNASHEAYKSCKKTLRFIVYIFTGRNKI